MNEMSFLIVPTPDGGFSGRFEDNQPYPVPFQRIEGSGSTRQEVIEELREGLISVMRDFGLEIATVQWHITPTEEEMQGLLAGLSERTRNERPGLGVFLQIFLHGIEDFRLARLSDSDRRITAFRIEPIDLLTEESTES